VTVILRPLAESDVDNIMTWVNDPDVVGNLAAFAGQPLTRADELEWIRRTLASSADVVFSILASDGERYLGQIGIQGEGLPVAHFGIGQARARIHAQTQRRVSGLRVARVASA